MIDGRFRVACALNCFNYISDNTLIVFDDFLDREYYHIVLDYYEIFEKGNNLVVLQKKNVEQPDENLIKKYESINN